MPYGVRNKWREETRKRLRDEVRGCSSGQSLQTESLNFSEIKDFHFGIARFWDGFFATFNTSYNNGVNEEE